MENKIRKGLCEKMLSDKDEVLCQSAGEVLGENDEELDGESDDEGEGGAQKEDGEADGAVNDPELQGDHLIQSMFQYAMNLQETVKSLSERCKEHEARKKKREQREREVKEKREREGKEKGEDNVSELEKESHDSVLTNSIRVVIEEAIEKDPTADIVTNESAKEYLDELPATSVSCRLMGITVGEGFQMTFPGFQCRLMETQRPVPPMETQRPVPPSATTQQLMITSSNNQNQQQPSVQQLTPNPIFPTLRSTQFSDLWGGFERYLFSVVSSTSIQKLVSPSG